MVALFKDLNPLGEQVSDIYLAKIGAMVSATVKGQFIIAVCQGVAGAISIYIAGLHDGFFMFVIFLTALSFIPLGSGIVTIPLGIGMAVFGNVVGGIFIVVFHIVVTTSIDNVLRPFLVPRSAHLHPALMLLAVFAGLQMFGFWGIVLGPVLMIVIVTTISMYLAVYKGAPLESLTGTRADPSEDDAERNGAVVAPAAPGQAADRSRRPPSAQPRLEELDDPLACLVGRMAVDLAHLIGEHRVRHPAEAVGVALLRVDLDDLERVAQPVLQRREPLAG